MNLKFPYSSRQPAAGSRKSQTGIALVITLIMLSVTLIMAVAFLAISRRERNAVTTTTDTAIARLAADSALANAENQIIANILSSSNLGAYNFQMLVSTNYINPYGYDTAAGANLTNVNYNYPNGTDVAGNDQLHNIANLLYLPRAPVAVVTNRSTGVLQTEARFYLDLNRNRRFDPSGFVTNYDSAFNVLTNDQGSPFISEIGDPEWIGVLERPDAPHGPNNRFLARYAFFAQPIGNSLDINHIHNQAVTRSLNANDGYFRNQGVGSWELNLAAFFTDLNTNVWGQFVGSGASAPPGSDNYYHYNQPFNYNINRGIAFDDARSLLAWRYNYSYLVPNINSADNLLGASAGKAAGIIPFDNIDAYVDGPLQNVTTNLDENTAPTGQDASGKAWVGADNPNHFFALPSELFDGNKSSVGANSFTNRLALAGSGNSTYDRYTYYRLLDQLGTSSAGDDTRLNLNYDNTDGQGNVIANYQTNLAAWTPLAFFTNAANRMLRHYTAQWSVTNINGIAALNTNYAVAFGLTNSFGVTNIPVYINGQFVYSPAVNRILQLAANMYDATTNTPDGAVDKDYPSVFRPIFGRDSLKDVYITGFQQVSFNAAPNINLAPLDNPVDVTDPSLALGATLTTPFGNVYGVPWIIGAKKNLPNFNQFYMLNAVQVTRKLQVTKPFFGAPVSQFHTNQMYVFSVSNSFGMSLWNSYSSNYIANGNLRVVARDRLTMIMTNNVPGFIQPQIIDFPFANVLSTPLFWSGTTWAGGVQNPQIDSAAPNPFIIPLKPTAVLLTNATYVFSSARFIPENLSVWETNVDILQLPRFGLLTTNRLQVFILDGNHVIDYVHFAGPDRSRILNDELRDPTSSGNPAYMWSTNGYLGGGTPYGVPDQIFVSKGNVGAPNAGGRWVKPPNLPAYLPATPAAEIAFFNGFFNVSASQYGQYAFNGVVYTNAQLSVQAPYTPTRTIFDRTEWQANDPLVHYLASDLNFADPGTTGIQVSDDLSSPLVPPKLNDLNARFQPWGQSTIMAQLPNVNVNAFDMAFKDPLMWRPDNWDFPTNKLASVGWLGRVHRGTPWQTIYLKASDVLVETNNLGNNLGANTWAQWTGDLQTINNEYFDAGHSAPITDSDLFDLFTTSLNDNAVRGTLSVNQTHLAAWSALFSGMIALTNITFNPGVDVPTNTWMVIDPAGPAGFTSALGQIVNGPFGINTYRSTFTNTDGLVGTFEHLGDILRVPALTEQSPFLNRADAFNTADRYENDLSDELYEWLPQQAMGLLRAGSSRFVIYCYGQALRPAPNSVLTGGGTAFFGMVTNYQVVAESAARAVIRVDNPASKAPHITVESFNPLPPD